MLNKKSTYTKWREIVGGFTPPYALRREIVGGFTHYYISFEDGQNIRCETEVSRLMVAEFMRCNKSDRRQRRWDERHREQSALTDGELFKRAFCPPKSVENSTVESQRNEELDCAIQRLPEIQRRRFILYFEYGLTYEQIAMTEGCTFQAVALTVKTAEKTIKKYLEKWA